jgi:hypothetical protein
LVWEAIMKTFWIFNPTAARQFAALSLALLAAGFLPSARGATVSIPPSKDATLFEQGSGTLANGQGQFLFAGRVGPTGAGAIRRTLLEFDVAGAIPSGSTIDSVELTLHMDTTAAGATAVGLRRVTAEWGEGASNADLDEGMGAASATGDATWIHAFFNTSTWTAAGGDFSGADSASISVAGTGDYSWGSTVDMVADVQEWLENPANNHGWILRGNEASATTAKRFISREHPTVADRPSLEITFTPPPIDNQIVWPSGTQTFQDMTDGDDATRITDWAIVTGGPSFTVQAQSGPARPGSSSTRWLHVLDSDAAGSNRFYSAYATAPTTPTGYSWTMYVNLESTPPTSGSTRPKLAVQHQRSVGGPLTMWGIELRDTGAYLVTLDAAEAVIAEELLYTLSGETAVGEWVRLDITVDFDQNRIFAAYNDNPSVSLPFAIAPNMLANMFRFCYRGNGTGNVMQLKFDDLTLSSALNVPVEMGSFRIE